MSNFIMISNFFKGARFISSTFSIKPTIKGMLIRFHGIYNNIYYFLILNNEKLRVFISIISFIFISFILNDNIIYCIDDINENVSSPETETSTPDKKRKLSHTVDSSILETSDIGSHEGTNSNTSSGFSINLENAFKYIGLGAAAAGVGVGGAKILSTLPPQSRAMTAISVTGLLTAYKTAVDTFNIVYGSKTNDSNLSGNISNIKIPDIEISSNIKVGDYSIDAKINKDELTLNNLKNISSSNISESLLGESSGKTGSFNDNVSSTINQNFDASSILEKGDLFNLIEIYPYLKIQFILLFTLCIALYALFALSIITIISKYGSTLDNHFKNKYILMYINLNRKYIDYMYWFWVIILFLCLLLSLIINFVLIDTFDIYFIQTH